MIKYIKKTKIRTYDDKIYTKYHTVNVPKDEIECKSFAVIFIDSLLACKKNI